MEKLTLNNLLSWNDVLALGDPCGYTSSYFGLDILKMCCNHKYDQEKLKDNFNKYIYRPFYEEFPEFLSDLNFFDIRFNFIKDGENNWKLVFSKSYFMTSLIDNLSYRKVDPDKLKQLNMKFLMDSDNMKEEVLYLLKKEKEKLSELIRISNQHPEKVIKFNHSTNMIEKKDNNELLDERKKLNWVIRNFDRIFDYFDRDFPIQVLEPINKDKFILNALAVCLIEQSLVNLFNSKTTVSNFMENELNDKIISIINYANNYSLMIDYLNQENKDVYDLHLTIDTKTGNVILPSEKLLESFKEIIDYVNSNLKYKDKFKLFSSYEELLSSKASETWKKIQNKKLVDNIKLKFDIIQSGTNIKIDKDLSKKRLTVVSSDSEKTQAKLKRDYDLLDQKFDYYGSKKPVIELVGISNFVGYFALFFENGSVVLDKFYRYGKDRRGKEKVLPAREEAIYIMNYKEFADLCSYTKSELIEEVRFNNPDVTRKYHNGNWQKRLDDIINSSGYGGLDLDFLNQLIQSLTGKKSDEKIYMK